MIFKQNPNVTLEYLTPDSQESFTITNDTLIAWRISSTDDSSRRFEDKFESLLLYNVYNKTVSQSVYSKVFSSLHCNQTKFKNIFENTVYKADDWMCFDFNAVLKQNITGSVSNSFYTYVSFILDICDLNFVNSTKSNCEDFEKIGKFILNNNIVIEFLYNDVTFRGKNYTNPLEKSITYFRNFLNINLMKRDTFYFQKTTVQDDIALLFNNEEEVANHVDIIRIENYVKFGTNEYLKEYYENKEFLNKNSIYLARFFYDQEYRSFTRKYMKIQDVFGSVNGFMQFLILGFGLIIFYSKYRYHYFLFDKLVNVKLDKVLFLNRKETEMKIINRNNRSNKTNNNVVSGSSNNKGEKSSSKQKFDVKNNSSNKESKNESKDKSSRNNNYLRSENVNVDKNKSDFINVSDNNQDSTRRQFNNKLEGVLEEENNNNNNKKKVNFPKVASVDNINVEISENPIQKNSFNEEDKKLFIDKLEKLSSESKNKRQYLKKNLCLYFFKSNDKKKSFDLKLQETYVYKIYEKFDIFYYFRLIRQFKNLKKYIFKEDNESQIFKILASNAYDISIKDYNDDFFKEDKNLKGIIEQWVKSINSVNQNSLSKYLFENHQMLIQN